MIICLVGFLSCKSNSQQMNASKSDAKTEVQEQEVQEEGPTFTDKDGNTIERINKTSKEWKKELSDQEYYVLREKGTERAFTGDLLNIKEPGVFICAACGFPLFETKTKFKSGTGWPSFYEPIADSHLKKDTDYDLGYARTEVMCQRCGGHLGHVFEDGPEPTGLRYCINSVSLDFEAEEK